MTNQNTNRFNVWLGFAGFLFIVAVAGGVVYGIIRVVGRFIALLGALNPVVAAQIVAAGGTVIAGVAAVVIGQQVTKRREIREAHRLKKVEVYSAFIQKVTDLIKDTKSGKDEDQMQKELIDFFIVFTRDLLLWGSPGVIGAFTKFRKEATTAVTTVANVDNILRQIRKDLGHFDFWLKRGELVGLLIKESDVPDLAKQVS